MTIAITIANRKPVLYARQISRASDTLNSNAASRATMYRGNGYVNWSMAYYASRWSGKDYW